MIKPTPCNQLLIKCWNSLHWVIDRCVGFRLIYHFCSYCLSHTSEDHKYKNSSTHRIAALYLKQCGESLSDYKVKIWFTFNAGKCLNRAKELYEKEDMENPESRYVEACCDKNSMNVFILEYNKTVDGWVIDHNWPDIPAKEVNLWWCRKFTTMWGDEVVSTTLYSLHNTYWMLQYTLGHKCIDSFV